jgi:HSP20 family protein
MARQDTRTNEQQNQQGQQGQQMARSQQEQRGMARSGGYPAGIAIAPADFFRLGPFSLMKRMNEELDRVFGEFGLNRAEEAKPGWAPAVEVTERDGKFVVRADLPGIKPEDVTLAITDDAVVLEGERKCEREEDKGGVHITERRYGRFYRAIPLPEGAKTDQAQAKFENGVLEVEVPVEQPKEQRRQIPIQSATQATSGSSGTQSSQGTQGSSERAA